MIQYAKATMNNGLKLIIHQDNSTTMAAINLLYDVGAKDESTGKTGTAHLLEHLMFSGSGNIASYDREVQKAAGENNAFTSNDITNYYIQLPAENLETGLWLESDRMLGLNFTQEAFDIQKNVVIEEYKQRYLNQPYGDIWMLLRPFVYKNHPYRWPAIGSDLSHIENITLDDIKQFYYEHYCPSNAILSIAGNVGKSQCIELVEKWFGTIPRRKNKKRQLPQEPVQVNPGKMEVTRDVPYHELIIAFRMGHRLSPEYYVVDLISDLFAGGKSSILYRHLVINRNMFSKLDAYITGDIDPGMFIIRGRLTRGTEMADAYKEVFKEIEDFISAQPGKYELEKVKNKLESTRQYMHTDIINKAMDLAYHELLGNAGRLNDEIGKYREVSARSIQKTARSLFQLNNSSTLFYYSNNKNQQF